MTEQEARDRIVAQQKLLARECLDDAAAAATASPAPSRPASPPTSPPPRDQDVNRPSADSALGEARPSV